MISDITTPRGLSPQRLAPRGVQLGSTQVFGAADSVQLTGVLAHGPAQTQKADGCYQNPVIGRDAPDPGVLHEGKEWWMVTTGGDGPSGAFPMYHSDDLVNWEREGTVFAPDHAPKWSNDSYWAPELHKVGDGFVAYFTARNHQGMLCVGAAHSKTLEPGSFKDIGHPLAYADDMGMIDSTFFKDDDGKQYLYWKEDGNGCNPQRPSRIMVQELNPSGLSFVKNSKPTEVLRNDREWEADVVEAPEIRKKDGFYYLFYSGNGYAGDGYAEGVARSRSPFGPFEKQDGPFVTTTDKWIGPGHASITEDNAGNDWLVYHAWEAGHVLQDPGRVVLIDKLEWKDGWPRLKAIDPTNDNQPAPTVHSAAPRTASPQPFGRNLPPSENAWLLAPGASNDNGEQAA